MPRVEPEVAPDEDTVPHPNSSASEATREYPDSPHHSIPLIDSRIFGGTPEKKAQSEDSPIKNDVSPTTPQEEDSPQKDENLAPMADSLKDYTEVHGTKYSSFDWDDQEDLPVAVKDTEKGKDDWL